MTRFRIRDEHPLVAIELTEVGEKQAALLEAFQAARRVAANALDETGAAGRALESKWW